MRRRVVITGFGCVTPLGTDAEQIWDQLLNGRSAVGPLTLFDAHDLPVRIAAEVRNWSAEDLKVTSIPWQQCPRQTQFAVAAGLKAVTESNLDLDAIDRRDMGIYLGCGEPFEDFRSFMHAVMTALPAGTYDSGLFARHAFGVLDREVEREYEPNRAGLHLARLLDIRGPVLNCIAACASSAQAIGEATRLIRSGDVDVMISGGAHSTIHPFGLTGFHRLSALSTRNDEPCAAARPFDRDRDGFVMGEGAAIFVLEELGHARRRGAEILAEVSGYGSAQDAFRITDVHPDGRGTALAIRRALQDAGLNVDEIDYINAHGTGTIMNDKVETIAIKRVFESRAYQIPVSSSKSMIGHATTACGAIELAICLMSLRDQRIHPTINIEHPDPDCDLDYVPNAARELRCRHILSPSIGFGGQNAALVVSRFDERCPSRIACRVAA